MAKYLHLSIQTRIAMKEPAIPPDERERLLALHAYNVVGTGPEQEYDEIVQLTAQICEIKTAHISLIDSERQWLKAKTGFGTQNIDRKLAFCSHTILHDDIFIVQDATMDDRFSDNPFVTGNPQIRFYAGMPLVSGSGHNIGSLCVIDVKPRVLRPDQIDALRTLSKQVVKQFELRKAVRSLEEQRKQLKETNEINNRLLSIIGHDVRAPLSSLSGLIHLITNGLLTQEEMTRVMTQVKNTITSAEFLLRDLLQWATAQQEKNSFVQEQVHLHEVIQELIKIFDQDFVNKGNSLLNEVSTSAKVNFDKNIVRFVFRNVLFNANKFTEQGTIRIYVEEQNRHTLLHIQDTGKGMPQERVNSLFDWKMKASTPGTRGEKGSGLALLLCYDLLTKNGATITVRSKEAEGSIFSIILPSAY